MQIPVIEDHVVIRADQAQRVLVSRPIKRIICKGKIAVRTTETPDELARVAIDFRAFTRAAAGKQNMAVRVKIERVHVRKIKTAAGVIDEIPLVPDIELIPSAPLENQLALRGESLDDLFGHRRGWVAPRDIAAHIYS